MPCARKEGLLKAHFQKCLEVWCPGMLVLWKSEHLAFACFGISIVVKAIGLISNGDGQL